MLAEPFLKTVVPWDASALARFKAHGYAAVNYQVQNDLDTLDFDLAPTKAAGLRAEVWGVTYDSRNFHRDGLLLGRQAVKLGAQGVTMNAEMCAKFTRSTRGLRSIILGVRDGGWTGPVNLNTYGAPANPDVNDFEMDVDSFLETGGGVAAQAYVNAHDEYHPVLVARYWRRMGVPEGRLNLTIGLYDPRSENPMKRQLSGAEYVPMLREAKIGRAISIFRPETALPNDLRELEAITLAPPPAPPPPPPAPTAPTTADTRRRMAAIAERWEAGVGGERPLSRITLARRIVDPDSGIPQNRWADLAGEAIKGVLDQAEAIE